MNTNKSKNLLKVMYPYAILFLMAAIIANDFQTSFLYGHMITPLHVFWFVFGLSVILVHVFAKLFQMIRIRSAPHNEV